MSAIYILWLRELKRYSALAGADRRLPGPAAAVPAGAGLRPGARVPACRQRQLPAVRRPRRHRDDGAVLVDLLRARPAVGPPVRLSEGDAGGAGAAHPDHAGPHAGRSHGGHDAGDCWWPSCA